MLLVRRAATKGTPTAKGRDRDEYPPAMSREGGQGSSVRHIDKRDNRGAGACIGNGCKKLKLKAGDKFRIGLF